MRSVLAICSELAPLYRAQPMTRFSRSRANHTADNISTDVLLSRQEKPHPQPLSVARRGSTYSLGEFRTGGYIELRAILAVASSDMDSSQRRGAGSSTAAHIGGRCTMGHSAWSPYLGAQVPAPARHRLLHRRFLLRFR